MIDFGKTLILSPHRDDEVLGCGILLDKLNHDNVYVFYSNSVHPNVAQDIYDAEAEQLRKVAGFSVVYSQYQNVNRLDQVPMADLVDELENVIAEIQPNTILLPPPSYNSDHRVVYEAAITATRIHDKNWQANNILIYEEPETIQTNRVYWQFQPHVFVKTSGVMYKLYLYAIYQSQQRAYRSPEIVTALAQMRGAQCGSPFAEAFMVVRMTT